MANLMFQSIFSKIITHFMNALFSIANILSAPYMYRLIRHLMKRTTFKIEMARLFNASLYVFGTLQNLMKIYLKYLYLVIRPRQLTKIMQGDPPPKTKPIKIIIRILA